MTEYNIRNDAIRLQILKCINTIRCITALALTVVDILVFQMLDLQKVGQGHRAQFSQCCPSM